VASDPCGWQAVVDDAGCVRPPNHNTPHRVHSPYGDGRWSEYALGTPSYGMTAGGPSRPLTKVRRGGGWDAGDLCGCGLGGDHWCAGIPLPELQALYGDLELAGVELDAKGVTIGADQRPAFTWRKDLLPVPAFAAGDGSPMGGLLEHFGVQGSFEVRDHAVASGPDFAAAREKLLASGRRLKVDDERLAGELRDRGWTVTAPARPYRMSDVVSVSRDAVERNLPNPVAVARAELERPHHPLCDSDDLQHRGPCRCRCGSPAAYVAPECAWHTSDHAACACGKVGRHQLTDDCGYPTRPGALIPCHSGAKCPVAAHHEGHPHTYRPVTVGDARDVVAHALQGSRLEARGALILDSATRSPSP
jgi:hypothetical protein